MVQDDKSDEKLKRFFSDRVEEMKRSASMSITDKARELKLRGEKIISLSIGEPDFSTPETIKEAGITAINADFTHYTSARGIPELLDSISRKLKEENSINADPKKNILVTPGTKQALFYINAALINPGDEAIIFEPYWVTYVDSLKMCGGIPIIAPGPEDNEFKPTAKQIENKITKKTKYILFSNPCNPSGAVWSKEELEQIVQIAEKHNILLVVDEIYEHILFDNTKFVSAASLPGAEKITITLNGFSKGPAMTGWRIGYVVAPEPLINEMMKIQEQIATCTSSISQKAAVHAYEQKEDIQRMVREYESRRNYLVGEINKIKGLRCQKPKGTFYLFVNISGTGLKSMEISDKMLSQAKVAVVPGIAYGEGCDDYIRLSFATKKEELEKAVAGLKEIFGGC